MSAQMVDKIWPGRTKRSLHPFLEIGFDRQCVDAVSSIRSQSEVATATKITPVRKNHAASRCSPLGRSAPRIGAALVEAAVCLPVIVMICMGAIEVANNIFLKQVLTQSAYEGARVVTTPGKTSQDAEVIAMQVLAGRNIEEATFSVSPTVNSSTPSGTEIKVTVTAPSDVNAIGPQLYFNSHLVQVTVTMVRN
ncbi:MAG: pilus assembly protein [Planctomycetaceae bacterium]